MSSSRIGAVLLAVSLAIPSLAASRDRDEYDFLNQSPKVRMSGMGQAATQVRAARASGFTGDAAAIMANGVCFNQRHCGGAAPRIGDVLDDASGAPKGGQAETSIAVDSTGKHVVVGFNDSRGWALKPYSLSGFMYSDDGGKTFVDGGQLPTTSASVWGDPDIKYLGACNFVYSSILVTEVEYIPGMPSELQTMAVHRSRDCGHTWEGPFEVTGASNPNGHVDSDGSPMDAADKEFMDVDRKSGRVLMSWSNFTDPILAPGGVQIETTYSDDILTATPPTWSKAAVVSATEADGQASIPRFAGDGKTAYVSWRRYPYPGTYFGYGNTVAFAKSTDGGATWGAPVETAPEFFTMDQVLGNDRINTSPSLAVNRSSRGHEKGHVYLVYANNDSGDGSDIAFQKSTDGGRTFSAPIFVNSRPGADRAQWFPWVTVDDASGRIFVFYFDQGVATSGDLTQVSYTFSDDDGRHWAAPARLSERTFHAGWGNDTGQPNIGDYNQAVAQQGKLFAAFGYTYPPPAGFADGQGTATPSRMSIPVTDVQVLPNAGHVFGAAPVDLVGVETHDFAWKKGSNGFIDAGESVGLKFTLRNSATNPLFARELDDLEGALTTSTKGVWVADGRASWRELHAGEAGANRSPFVIMTDRSFVPGTPIELTLTVRADDFEKAVLRHTLFTGTPVATMIFAEDFENNAAGWGVAHGGGANVVPWKLDVGSAANPGFCGSTSQAMFHANAEDGAGKSPARWERLLSPKVVVPADAEYVTLDFDVCYDTEDDPNFNVTAYDGFFLRIADYTTGRLLRSVLVEAFEDEFTTGSFQGYPKHLPRSSNGNYFEDMSAWGGDSGGMQHVRLRLPGMAGSTVQLRFEFTQDGGWTCADVRPGDACGVLVDNIVMKSVVSAK